MKQWVCIFIISSLTSNLLGQDFILSGQVKDDKNNPLPFSSIIIKGTSTGTSANSAGFFSLPLRKGKYEVTVQHVGYRSEERSIEINKQDVYIDFMLSEQQYNLGNVTIRNGEDPAYEIIRNAIAKRSFYESELNNFSAEVYIKGLLRLRDYPKRILGQKVDFEDGDTSKRKVIFLSETLAKYSVKRPDEKVQVISTKVSGQSDGFGFSNPQIISFYQNNIELARLNPRGFISPIADYALNFYNYKFEGTFFENGRMINRIMVSPKKLYEPLFNGHINIIEEEWRIHSLQLSLFKKNQMQFADTLVIEQLYVPLKGSWVIKHQTIYPSVKFLGFDAYGSFVQLYDKYDLSPSFSKKFFNSTILQFTDSSNKKPPAYWDSVRPVPLIAVEINDYKKKDSLEQLRKDPRFLDSLDRVRNKIEFSEMLFNGKTFSKEKNNFTVSINSLIDLINFNTMEGLVLSFEPTYVKRWDRQKRDRLTIGPQLRYGFSNGHFNPNLLVKYDFGKTYRSSVSVLGGRRVFQFDNRDPISEFSNTVNTLLYSLNYLKLYEAATANINFSKGLGEGVTINAGFKYQDRKPLDNTTNYAWRKVDGMAFTPNLTFTPHQAAIATLSFSWQPGAKYIEFPDRKIMLRSKYPVFAGSYTHGISGLFGSDVDYSKWKLSMSHEINAKQAGRFSYNLVAGGFFSDKKAYLMDYNHYLANQFSVTTTFLHSFQLMPYYVYSNSSKVYAEEHLEYHLNGFLTNKIPLFKKLNWFLLAGNNFLYINSGTTYTELFIGLENIFKIGRIDYVQSFKSKGGQTSGIRFTLKNLTR